MCNDRWRTALDGLQTWHPKSSQGCLTCDDQNFCHKVSCVLTQRSNLPQKKDNKILWPLKMANADSDNETNNRRTTTKLGNRHDCLWRYVISNVNGQTRTTTDKYYRCFWCSCWLLLLMVVVVVDDQCCCWWLLLLTMGIYNNKLVSWWKVGGEWLMLLDEGWNWGPKIRPKNSRTRLVLAEIDNVIGGWVILSQITQQLLQNATNRVKTELLTSKNGKKGLKPNLKTTNQELQYLGNSSTDSAHFCGGLCVLTFCLADAKESTAKLSFIRSKKGVSLSTAWQCGRGQSWKKALQPKNSTPLPWPALESVRTKYCRRLSLETSFYWLAPTRTEQERFCLCPNVPNNDSN